MTGSIIDRPGEQRELWDCAPTVSDAPPGQLHAGEDSSTDAVVNLPGHVCEMRLMTMQNAEWRMCFGCGASTWPDRIIR